MLFIVPRVTLALAFLAVVAGSCTDAVGDEPRAPLANADDASVDAPVAQPPARGAIRVATFNVHRLFDTVCDSANCGPGAFEAVVAEGELDTRITKLAEGIAALDADVLALQEIENLAVFERLRARLETTGLHYVTAELGETGAPASMDVAIFARGVATEIRRHRDEPLTRPDGSGTTFSRELLEARLVMRDEKVFFFAAHFRSKVDDDPGRRYAEAAKTRDIMIAAAAEDPTALVVLGGDLNDEPGSGPLNALESGGALVRVAQDIPPAEQTTFVRDGRGIAIDHVYAEKSGAARYVPGSASVVRDLGSDHAALRADFDAQK